MFGGEDSGFSQAPEKISSKMQPLYQTAQLSQLASFGLYFCLLSHFLANM